VPSYFNPSLVKFQPYDMENNLQGFSKVFFSSIAYQDQYKNGKPIDINEFFDTLGKPIHKNLAYQYIFESRHFSNPF
jgi:ABC-type transport system substrate-binding protein